MALRQGFHLGECRLRSQWDMHVDTPGSRGLDKRRQFELVQQIF